MKHIGKMTPQVRHGSDAIQAGASALSPLCAQGFVSPAWFGAGLENVAGDPASHAAVGFLAWRRDELLWRAYAALSPRRAVSSQDHAAPAAVGIPLENVRDRARRPVAVAGELIARTTTFA